MQGAVPLLAGEEPFSIQKYQKSLQITNSQITVQKQSALKTQTTALQCSRNQNKETSLLALKNKISEYAFLTSSLLRELIQQDTQADPSSDFDSATLNEVNLQTYIKYIHSKTKFSPQCMIIALIYIDRYNLQNQDFNLSKYNVHKLLLTCLLLATKYHDEIYYDNKAFQHGGGISNIKLFQLELQVFQSLRFNLHIDDQYYFEFLNSIQNAYLMTQEPQQQTQNQDSSS